jgi:hypothetical protein
MAAGQSTLVLPGRVEWRLHAGVPSRCREIRSARGLVVDTGGRPSAEHCPGGHDIALSSASTTFVSRRSGPLDRGRAGRTGLRGWARGGRVPGPETGVSGSGSTWAALPGRRPAGGNGGRGGLPRKEVIQPHLPVRLPCYDFVPIAGAALDTSPPVAGVGPVASGVSHFHDVTGGVYKARERIHRRVLTGGY